MHVSNHCKDRYAERIKGIEDYNERKQWLAQNDEVAEEHINKMFEHAKFVFKGQIGDKVTRSFYIRDNIVMVLDSQEECIITLYKVDFGFPEQTNRKVIDDLLLEIDKYNDIISSEKSELDSIIEQKNFEIEQIDAQIKLLSEQINMLKFKKSTLEMEISDARMDFQMAYKKAEHYATMLCNSLDFKKDIKAVVK